MFWVLLFYAFAALCGAFLWFMFHLSHPKFRDEIGDIISEVGYEEDAVGRDLNAGDPDSLGSYDDPHAITGAHSGQGVM